MNKTERKSVLSLSILYATRMLGLFMVLPVFMLYGPELEGANALLVGVAIGAYGLSQALFQIPFGSLSDRYGRKPLLFFGLTLFLLGSLVAALSESIYGVILGRFIQGAGAIASVIMALASDLTSVENRTKAMAFIGMSIGMSFMAALILGPVVADFGGIHAIFWLTAVMALLAMAWTAWFIPNPRITTRHRDAQVFSEQISNVLKDRELLRLDAGIFVLHLALTSIFIAIPVSLVEYSGLAGSDHSWVYLFVLLGSFIAMIPFIILGEKKQRMKEVFCMAIVLLSFSALSMTFTQGEFEWFVISMFVFFMGFNLLEASLPSLVSKISPAGVKGTAMGVYSTSQFLGAFLGGILGGWLLGFYGESAVYLCVALLCSFWFLLALTMARPKHAKSLILEFERELDDQEMVWLSKQLMSVVGVEDVIVVPDGVAYLKVVTRVVDQSALNGIKEQLSMRSNYA